MKITLDFPVVLSEEEIRHRVVKHDPIKIWPAQCPGCGTAMMIEFFGTTCKEHLTDLDALSCSIGGTAYDCPACSETSMSFERDGMYVLEF